MVVFTRCVCPTGVNLCVAISILMMFSLRASHGQKFSRFLKKEVTSNTTRDSLLAVKRERFRVNVSQDINTVLREYTDYACGQDAFCNVTLSRFPGRNCTLRCDPCQCDDLCHLHGDCCPDLLLLDNSEFPPAPSLPTLSCSVGSEIKFENFTNIFMVQSCLPGTDPNIQRQCEEANITDREQAIPVSDLHNGLTYRNRFCAGCNKVVNFSPWSLDVTCRLGASIQTASSKSELWRLVLRERLCSIIARAPDGISPRECLPVEIEHCNATGDLVDAVDPMLQNLCRTYRHPVYYYHSPPDYIRFRSVFCAICNGADIDKVTECIGIASPDIPPPLIMLLDFNPKQRHSLDVPIEEDWGANCPSSQVFDPFSEYCERIQCPKRWMVTGDECEAIFASPNGLGFSLTVLVRAERSDHRLVIQDLDVLYQDIIHTELQDFKPFLVRLFFSIYFTTNPSPTDDAMADLAVIRAQIVSQSTRSLGKMERQLRHIVDKKLHQHFGEENITLLQTAVPCFTLTEIPKEYTLMKTGQFVLRPLSDLEKDCRKRDCNTGLLYEPVQLNCPFIEYNISHANFTFIPENNTVIFDGLIHQMDKHRVLLCRDILKVCKEELVMVTDIMRESRFRSSPDPQPEGSGLTLSIVSLVCVSLSLVGLVLAFLTYSILPKLRTLPGKNTMALIFHLFWAQLLFLTTVNRSTNQIACQVFAVLIHYFWLSSFSWMTISAYHMKTVFSTLKFYNEGKASELARFGKYTAVCIVLPLLVIGSCLTFYLVRSRGAYSGYGGRACFLSNPLSIGVFFAAPLGLMLLFNTFFFLRTILAIRSVPDMKTSTNSHNKHHFFVYIKMSLLFGFTWVFGILAVILQSEPLSYVFNVLTGSQGSMLFIAYCVNRRTWKLITETYRPQSDSSRTTSVGGKKT